MGEQWLSGRVLDSRPRDRGFEPRRCHCVVFSGKTHLSLLSTGWTRKPRPEITEKVDCGHNRIRQTNHDCRCHCTTPHMHPLGKARVFYTELLTMLMTSLARDADASRSSFTLPKLRQKGTFRPESIVSGFTKLNKIKTQIK